MLFPRTSESFVAKKIGKKSFFLPSHTPGYIDLFGDVKLFKVCLLLIHNVVEQYEPNLCCCATICANIYTLEKNLAFKSNLCERSIKKLSTS